MIIEQMNTSILEHEQESADMAQKLTIMKNQMMHSDQDIGMAKKYGAVKIGTIKDIACTVSIYFVDQFLDGVRRKFKNQ